MNIALCLGDYISEAGIEDRNNVNLVDPKLMMISDGGGIINNCYEYRLVSR